MKQQEVQAKDLERVNGNIQTQATTTEVDPDSEHANKWAVLAIVAVGIFMATLDTSIVNISLPTIAHYFGVALSGAIEWVIIAYLVVIAAIGIFASLVRGKEDKTH